MRERPILFSGEMVRAILEGRKTQTRRVVHPDINVPETEPDYVLYRCPYGKPGDQLWVRETHANVPEREGGYTTYYKAEGMDYFVLTDGTEIPLKWTPSIHMPRWASRIDLRITDIRIERVQDIDEVGALSEGTPIEYFKKVYGTYKESHQTTTGEFLQGSARDAFSRLWDSINGKKHPWESNPWVWVIEFERGGE